MTETPEDIAQSAAAQAAGEAAAEQHQLVNERMHATIGGSAEWQEPALTPDDVAQPGIGTPGPTPPTVVPQAAPSPLVSTPTDNSQSQP